MRPRDSSRRRLLTQDERVLWTTFTRAIAPLRASAAPQPETEAGGPPAEPALTIANPAPPMPTRRGAPPPVTTTPVPPTLMPLGRRLRQRVARGKEAIDGRLDLHGLTQSEAHAALLHFLRKASAREARLALVITGKGAREGGERGVLKRQVPQWLGTPEFRAYVIGFEDAHVAHGGEGALYVKIRRMRDK